VLELDSDAVVPPPPHLRGPVRELVRGACPLPDRLLLLLDVDRVLRAIAGGAASS
jgi:chemotaxis signal transduction protein